MSLFTEYNVHAYLAAMGVSAVCCCVLYALSARKRLGLPGGRAAALGASLLLLGTVLGILGAKLFYFLFRFFYLIETDAGAFWLSLKTEELSYYGGVAGVILAVFFSAKLFGLSPAKALNAFAAAGALMAAAARFAECFLFPAGTGAYLDQSLPFPLAVSIVYSEDYTECILAVYTFEGLFSLLACALSLGRAGEPRRFLRTLFYLCLPQILLESLRTEAINLLFVHLEQLVCYLFVEGVLVWYGWKCGRKRFSSWVPALAGLAVCGLTIMEEFMLDGKILLNDAFIPQWITYLLMAAGLAVLAAAEHAGNRRLTHLKSALAK